MRTLFQHHQDLMIAKITGTLTEDEAFEVNGLLSNDPEFQRAYDELLKEFPEELYEENLKNLERQGFWRDLKYELPPIKRPVRKINIFTKAAIAAALAGLVFSAWFFYSSSDKRTKNNGLAKQASGIMLKLSNGKTIDLSATSGTLKEGRATLVNSKESLSYATPDENETGINTIVIPEGKDYKIVLSDGSEIWMNSKTQLDFPFNFSGKSREITISGEAYCRIAKDASRPFIIHLPKSSVNVLGTEFNVNSYNENIVKVALVQGSVNVAIAGNTAILTPGTEGAINIPAQTIIKQPFDAKNVLSWREGLYYFDEASLDEISMVIKRWYTIDVAIDNNLLKERKFKGLLNKKDPLKVFLEDLKAISKLAYYFDKDNILHFK